MASIGRLVLAGCLLITLSGAVSGQSRSSLTDRDSGDAATAARLNEQLLLAREAIRNLTESLALANSENEIFKRQAEDLQSQLEALGFGAGGGKSELEQRLLASVNDLTRAQKDSNALLERLIALSEAVQAYIASSESNNPQVRAALETELRAANKAAGNNLDAFEPLQPGSPTIGDATVVEFKPEFALVVANVGRAQGVRLGMPFQVWRGNTRVGEVRVVDVRERISGAVVQNLSSEENPVQVGDRLRVDARR